MFDSDVSRDDGAGRRTRRVFVAGAIAAAAGLAGLWKFRTSGVEASVVVRGTPGAVTIVDFGEDGTNRGKRTVAKLVKTDGEWYRQLGANSFGISRQGDTEMPFPA